MRANRLLQTIFGTKVHILSIPANPCRFRCHHGTRRVPAGPQPDPSDPVLMWDQREEARQQARGKYRERYRGALIAVIITTLWFHGHCGSPSDYWDEGPVARDSRRGMMIIMRCLIYRLITRNCSDFTGAVGVRGRIVRWGSVARDAKSGRDNEGWLGDLAGCNIEKPRVPERDRCQLGRPGVETGMNNLSLLEKG